MSRPRIALACVTMMIAACGLVSAQEAPKWSYVQVGYNNFSPETGPSDSGSFAGLSLGLFHNFHILAEYDDAGDYTNWNAGLGWHGLLGEPGDLFGEVQWRDVKVDSSTAHVSDSGYVVDGGVRWKLGKWFDIKGQVNWVDLDKGGSDTTFGAEGVVTLLGGRLGLGANAESGNSDTYRVFARWAWGK